MEIYLIKYAIEIHFEHVTVQTNSVEIRFFVSSAFILANFQNVKLSHFCFNICLSTVFVYNVVYQFVINRIAMKQLFRLNS